MSLAAISVFSPFIWMIIAFAAAGSVTQDCQFGYVVRRLLVVLKIFQTTSFLLKPCKISQNLPGFRRSAFGILCAESEESSLDISPSVVSSLLSFAERSFFWQSDILAQGHGGESKYAVSHV